MHPKHILIKFGSGNPFLEDSEVLAKDKALSKYGDPTTGFSTYGLNSGNPFRIYLSQPICWFSDGETFDLKEMVIKITDFGKGIF